MEQKILLLLQSKNEEAISLLYDKYSASIYGCILRIVHSPEIAEDILQETFVKAWRYGPSYNRTKGRLFTWLHTIARNSAIDVMRCNAWKMSKETCALTCISDWKIEAINAEVIDLRELVGKLDPKYRVLIELIYFQGYTKEQIEQELGIKTGTIKNRLRAAIKHLRTNFDLHSNEENIKQKNRI